MIHKTDIVDSTMDNLPALLMINAAGELAGPRCFNPGWKQYNTLLKRLANIRWPSLWRFNMSYYLV